MGRKIKTTDKYVVDRLAFERKRFKEKPMKRVSTANSRVFTVNKNKNTFEFRTEKAEEKERKIYRFFSFAVYMAY